MRLGFFDPGKWAKGGGLKFWVLFPEFKKREKGISSWLFLMGLEFEAFLF